MKFFKKIILLILSLAAISFIGIRKSLSEFTDFHRNSPEEINQNSNIETKEVVNDDNLLILVKVIKVYDGDTITIINENGEKEKIRLYGINARELQEDYGTKARDYLRELILEKEIKLERLYKDRYNRTVGKIFLNDLDISQEMVKQGQAFIYHKYNHDLDIYNPLENYAKENKLGMYEQNN